MNTAILYHSIHHGNTRKVAHALAEPLGADLYDIADKPPCELEHYNLIGFGSGIYFLRHSDRLMRLAQSLKPLYGKKAFIFSTRGWGPLFLYHMLLRRTLKASGFGIVGEFSCKGLDTYGLLKVIGGINRRRPNEKDLERAAHFALWLVR
jgi:flavodoxin